MAGVRVRPCLVCAPRVSPRRVCHRGRGGAPLVAQRYEGRHAGRWRGAEATASIGAATGERSGRGLSWGRRRASAVLLAMSAARPGLLLALALAYLESEMRRLQGKGKMLPDWG